MIFKMVHVKMFLRNVKHTSRQRLCILFAVLSDMPSVYRSKIKIICGLQSVVHAV